MAIGEGGIGVKTVQVRYWKLLIAYSVSTLGDNIFKVVLLWWVASTTDSLTIVSVVSAISAATMAVCGTVSGAVADLVDRRLFMMISDVVRGFILILMGGALALSALSLPSLFLCVILIAAIQSVYFPSVMAWLPDLVPSEDLVKSNATLQMAQNAGWLVGPMLAGLLMDWRGAPVGLLTTAGVYFFSAAMLFTIGTKIVRPPNMPIERSLRAAVESVFQKAAEGLRVVGKDTLVRWLLAVTAVLNLLMMPIIVFLPIIVQRVYGLGPAYYGYMEAGLPVGMILGSLVIARVGFKASPQIALVSVAMLGVLCVLFGVTRDYWLGLVWLVLIGVQMAVASVVGRTIFQERVNSDTRGTVFGFMNLLTNALQPIGMGLAGILGDLMGMSILIVGSGLGLIGIGAVATRLPVIKAYGKTR